MATYHVVPRGDAINHNVRSDKCACIVEIKTFLSNDSASGYDTWLYHRTVSLEEAVLAPHIAGAA